MAAHINAVDLLAMIAEAIEIADPVAINNDRGEVQQAVIAACGTAGPHAFAIAAVTALATTFGVYQGSREVMGKSTTQAIANLTLAIASAE